MRDEQTATVSPTTLPATASEAERLLQAAVSMGAKVNKKDRPMVLRILGANEDNLIKGLSVFLKYSRGRYPSSLEGSAMPNELEVLTRPGIKSGELKIGDQEKKELSEILFAQAFYNRLVRDKRDVKYYGKGTTVAAPGRMLVRWNNDRGGYRVIHFDLRGEDVDAKQLADLEQANPPAMGRVN